MKKKCLPLVFTALCLILCMIPSVGMIFRSTTEPIGNERAVEDELPDVTKYDAADQVRNEESCPEEVLSFDAACDEVCQCECNGINKYYSES